MPKPKEFDMKDPFGTWPPVLQTMLVHAVHIAATLEDAPKRCRLRDCRKTGNCMSRLSSIDDIVCHGGLSEPGALAVAGMILLLVQLATPNDRLLL